MWPIDVQREQEHLYIVGKGDKASVTSEPPDDGTMSFALDETSWMYDAPFSSGYAGGMMQAGGGMMQDEDGDWY
jgi:hypothetical protein